MTLGEVAGLLTALGAVIGGLVTYFTWHGNVNAKTQSDRVEDLQEVVAALRRDFEWQRDDLTRQITDLKKQVVDQENTIRRQDHQVSDYARHVTKLESIMREHNMKIPEFVITDYIGGMS